MPDTPAHKPLPLWQRLRFTGLAAAMLLCLAAILTLAADVQRRLTALDRSRVENTQWVLNQAEVELLRLNVALLQAQLAPDAPLQDFRSRFDVFYSRICMLQESSSYQAMLHHPSDREDLSQLRRFLDDNIPLIDGPDTALRAALPQFTGALVPARSLLRALTVRGMAYHAAQSDQEGATIRQTLIRLAGLTVVLVVVLIALAAGLARLYRRSRRQAEDNRRTGARLETIVATSADAILVTDAKGRVLDCNRATEATFGHSRAALLGQDAMSILFPADVEAAQRELVIHAIETNDPHTRAPLRLEMEAQHGDGSRFAVEVSLATARYAGGSMVVALLRDISDRRRAELDLTEARDRALAGERAKADFLAVMSHEMRTPLNGLVGSVELLAATPLDAAQAEIVRVLATSSDILLSHVNAVLDIARTEAGKAQPLVFDADRLLADVVANQAGLALASGNRIGIRPLSGAIGTVAGDPARLRQILLNLVGNAVKFTRNGTITVETRVLDDTPRRVEFRVIDTGIGITRLDLDLVFEDFVTLDSSYDRRAGGTGLGLGIARRLAAAMAGEIGADSVPGVGSRFWLRLPLPVAGAPAVIDAARPVPASAPLPASPPLDVLLIEDNDINRFIARRFLETAGHRVAEAQDGQQGLALADSFAFDVVLTDISMPGLDGFEVARRLRTGNGRSAAARIIATTAHAVAGAEPQYRAAGMDGWLQKPLTRAMLVTALTAVPPPVDPAHLAELQAQIGDEALTRLIAQMIADGDRITAQIMAVGADAVGETVAELAHQLAGAVGALGARRFQERLTRLVRTAHLAQTPYLAETAHLAQTSDLAQTALRAAAFASELAAVPGQWQAIRAALAAYALTQRQDAAQ